MKKIQIKFFIFVLAATLPLPLMAADPVLEVNCQPGGEYGNVINLKLSKDSQYGKLVIKRKNTNANHPRDLSGFTGGNFRLDLSTRGGITGYTIEYAPKEATEMLTGEGPIDCSKPDTVPTDIEEPQTVTPPPTPEPESAPEPETTPPPPAPEPEPESDSEPTENPATNP